MERKIKLRKLSLFCLITILTVLPMIFLLQETAIAQAASTSTPGFSVANGEQISLPYQQTPKGFDNSSSDMPRSYMLGGYDETLLSEILELQKSSSSEGESIFEYTLTLSHDSQSYQIIPLCRITPIQKNGNVIALVGTDPEDGSFMWLTEFNGTFPSFSPSKAFEILSSQGYSMQNDTKLVFFNFETYWMFNITIGQNLANAFVSFNGNIRLATDMLEELKKQQSDTSCILRGSLPSSYNWMVGKVPYFEQGSFLWCAVRSLQQSFWWWGTMVNGHYVTEIDIANHFGLPLTPPSEGLWLGQIDEAFVHFMGHDDGSNLDHSWGSSSKDVAKSWIYANAPEIAAILAPGTDGDYVNHAVSLIGWDDDLGGGSWAIHDTAPFFGIGYDVWVSYSTFDEYWDKAWFPLYTRGAASAIPGDKKYPSPMVSMATFAADIKDSETLSLHFWLGNNGQDKGLTEQSGAQGIFVRLSGAEFLTVTDYRGFKDWQGYDEYGNRVPLWGAKIAEFYSDWDMDPTSVMDFYVTIRPVSIGQLTIYYRGWITDEDDTVREDWSTIDDSRPGTLNTPLAEYRILRDPVDIYNDRDPSDWLNYPTKSASCRVTDDDTTGPEILYPLFTAEIDDSSTEPYWMKVVVRDDSDVYAVNFRYKFDDGPWSSWYEPTFSGAYNYEYDIPRSVWIEHVSSRVYFQVYAEDNDKDRLDDRASTLSPEYRAGTIIDDDVTGPESYYPPTTSRMDDTWKTPYEMFFTAYDASGVKNAWFRYRFGSQAQWSPWFTPTGFHAYNPYLALYWYDIPRGEWIYHVGEEIWWQAKAEDNDNDRPNDTAVSYSPEYLGWTILDDDPYGPSISNPTLIYIEATGDVYLQVSVSDPSGIEYYGVWFRYMFAGDSWTSWQIYDVSGWPGETFWYTIPETVWLPHKGEGIWWQVRARDWDVDRPPEIDAAITESPEYFNRLPGVSITIEPPTATVQPGSSTTYTVTIQNYGPIADIFDLTLQGLNPSWYTFSPTSITIDNGQAANVTLTISPPKVAMILKYYSFTVTATPRSHPKLSESASATVNVDFTPTLPTTPTGGLAIAVQPKTIYMSAGTKLTINIYVKNNQNFDDAITVDITNSGIPTQYQANLAWFGWTQVKVYIPAGSNINIPLEITLPAGTQPPGGTLNAYVFRAVATSTAIPTIIAKDSGIIKLQ